jgi:predicted ArsR family transcriptional regulator
MSVSVREQIIDYLARYSTANAPELSSALQVTKPGIQYHLKLLIEDELVERVDAPGNRKSRGRGRPINYYRLSRVSQPDNLKALVSASLSLFQQLQGQAADLDLLKKLAMHLFPDTGKRRSLPLRLKQTVEQLNQYAYQASWEAHQKGPVILFRNCPYKSIWPDHPELCEMDRLALEHLTRVEASEVACINQVEPFSPFCLFSLHGE